MKTDKTFLNTQKRYFSRLINCKAKIHMIVGSLIRNVLTSIHYNDNQMREKVFPGINQIYHLDIRFSYFFYG